MTNAVDDNWSLLVQPFRYALSLRCKNVDGIAVLSLCVKTQRSQSWAKVLRLYIPDLRHLNWILKVYQKTQTD